MKEALHTREIERMKSCEKCKYSELDYIFDNETGDEYQLFTCEKGNDVSLDFECEDFEEYKREPYEEKDTECDLCEHLSSCEERGYVLEITKFMDSRRHFIRGFNCPCKKRGDSWQI